MHTSTMCATNYRKDSNLVLQTSALVFENLLVRKVGSKLASRRRWNCMIKDTVVVKFYPDTTD